MKILTLLQTVIKQPMVFTTVNQSIGYFVCDKLKQQTALDNYILTCL